MQNVIKLFNQMKYLNFFTDEKALAYVIGSPIEDINRVEKELDGGKQNNEMNN